MTNYTQWYNANEDRAYPFKESASLIAINGLQLPADFLVDMNIVVPDSYATNIYCSYIKITPSIISLGIASATAGLFMATFSTSDIEPYKAYQLNTLMPNISGWVVFGNYVASQPEIYRFSNYQNSEIDSKVVHVVESAPVTKIIKLGEANERYVSKIVKLVAGSNVRIFKHETTPNVIVFELTNPEEFLGPCNSRVDVTADRVSLHSINKIKPNEDGIITIRFDG